MTFETHEFAREIQSMLDDIVKTEKELEEKALMKAIDKNDFIVGDKCIQYQLERILPTGANIIYSKHANPNMVYVVKKIKIPTLDYCGEGLE